MKDISGTELLIRTKDAAQNEKNATLLLLDYLQEVDRRRLFAERAYSSLFEFVVKELGYSECQASERINAMRLINEVSEVKNDIQSGNLSITAAAQIQRFIKSEKKLAGREIDLQEKRNIISECKNKSKREVEKILFKESALPSTQPFEKERVISAELTELKFSAPEETIKKLRELQNFSDISMLSIFEAGLERLLLERKARYRPLKEQKAQNSTLPVEPKSDPSVRYSSSSRYIPKSMHDQVSKRSQNRCEYIDPKTQRRCESRFRLQFEHEQPYALGGRTSFENILHYCHSHNQLAAIKVFGPEKMKDFVPGLE